MAPNSGLVRAGFPHANIHRALAALVQEAGLSVVVVEETADAGAAYGAKPRRKKRYVSAVLTPAQVRVWCLGRCCCFCVCVLGGEGGRRCLPDLFKQPNSTPTQLPK